MHETLISFWLHAACVCVGVAVMLYTTRWTSSQWAMWASFILVTGILVALLHLAGFPVPVV